ncbi:MAG: hypothetical protein ACOYK6_03855 [Chthoniobacterales bacterium]
MNISTEKTSLLGDFSSHTEQDTGTAGRPLSQQPTMYVIGVNPNLHLYDKIPETNLSHHDVHDSSSLKESSITVVEPALEESEKLEEQEDLLPQSPLSTYGTFPSSNPTSNAAADFSRPKQWDLSSLVEAQRFYQTQLQHTANPKLRERYHQVSLFLTKTIESQEALRDAAREKIGDAKSAYQDALFNYSQATQCFLKEDDRSAHFLKDHATEFMHAASHFKNVVSLAKPHELTGPLRVKIRNEYGTTQEYNLSEFSFEQEGAMKEYYRIISSHIVGGSNMETIQDQKSLIESARKHLRKATEYPVLGNQNFPTTKLGGGF